MIETVPAIQPSTIQPSTIQPSTCTELQRIVVSQSNISDGMLNLLPNPMVNEGFVVDSSCCPVAQALSEQVGGLWMIHSNGRAEFFRTGQAFDLPDNAKAFIENFDLLAGTSPEAVTEIEFEIPLQTLRAVMGEQR